jgi:hypothetical protein
MVRSTTDAHPPKIKCHCVASTSRKYGFIANGDKQGKTTSNEGCRAGLGSFCGPSMEPTQFICCEMKMIKEPTKLSVEFLHCPARQLQYPGFQLACSFGFQARNLSLNHSFEQRCGPNDGILLRLSFGYDDPQNQEKGYKNTRSHLKHRCYLALSSFISK